MSYEIRQMSFGEILDMGFRLLRNHLMLLATPAAALYVPLALATEMLAPEAVPENPDDLAVIGLIVVPMLLVVLLASPVVTAAITYSLGELYLGRSITVAESMRAGFSVVLPLVGTWILAGFAIVGGFLLFIIPGIYLVLAFLLLTQVMVLERAFGTRALGRSRELMSGNMLRGFGVLFVGGVLVSFLSYGVQIGLGWIPVLGPVGSGLAQALSFAYTSALGVVLYFDIRCRKEAFDLEHLSHLVEARTAAPPTLGV